jgi:hypothetical protein
LAGHFLSNVGTGLTTAAKVNLRVFIAHSSLARVDSTEDAKLPATMQLEFKKRDQERWSLSYRPLRDGSVV